MVIKPIALPFIYEMDMGYFAIYHFSIACEILKKVFPYSSSVFIHIPVCLIPQ